MNNEFYYELINQLPLACVYHKIIYDKNGAPEDCEFVGVNNSFEKLTAIDASRVKGKRFSQVLPKVFNDNFDWISALGEVALNDKSTDFNAYSDYFAKMFKIHAYSPQEGFIVAFLSDITDVFEKSCENQDLYSKYFKIKQKANENEMLFKTLFEQVPIGIAFGKQYDFICQINPAFERIMGRSKEELCRISWIELTHQDDLQKDMELFKKFKKGEIPNYSMIKRFIKPDGSFVWVYMVVARFDIGDESEYNSQHICMIQDISMNINSSVALRESERSKASLLSRLPGIAYRCLNDKYWTMEYISEGCYELTGYKKESLLHNAEISFYNIVSPEYIEQVVKDWADALKNHAIYSGEYEIVQANGEKKWVLEQGHGIYDEKGRAFAIEGLIIDISENKKQQMQINFLNDHDKLTRLYNRRYFDEQMKRLQDENIVPVSVIIGDINGVRLVNNAFGHEGGDSLILETSKCMKKFCRDTDIIARTGGDDFSILLPGTDYETAVDIMKKIKAEYESIHIKEFDNSNFSNISLGCSTKTSSDQTLSQIYSVAEDYMYKRKLLDRKSSHSAILTSIMATLLAKSQETENHAERLAQISKMLGDQIGLAQKNLDLLKLFAMLHDIGKIGIDDRILNKPGKLDDDEWEVMKKHPEIGYKIAISSPELESIAELILTHHEHWDGSGYPQGLKGDSIPLLSRILAVSDAYDAMTKNRVYRTALSKEEAINEIVRCSGTQFDPQIVGAFQKIVHSEGFYSI